MVVNHRYNDTVCRWCPVVSSHKLSWTLCKLHRMILIKLGTSRAPTISHSIGINANTLLFYAGKLYLPIITTFAWRPFSGTGGNVQVSGCSFITWSLMGWRCSMQSVVRLGRSLAFSTEDSTITLRVVLLYFSSTSPSLGPILIMTHLVPLAISKGKTELENVRKICMLQGYWTMGQQWPPRTCWPSNTWMPKAGNLTRFTVQDYQQTVLLWWNNFHRKHFP